MFGFPSILSASLSLLLASRLVAAVETHSSQLSVRQTPGDTSISPGCTAQCTPLYDVTSDALDPASTCTDAIMSKFETCFDCEAVAGTAPVDTLQDAINSFVQSCADVDRPVRNVTVVGKQSNGGGSTNSTSEGSTKNGRGERLSLGVFSPVVMALAILTLVAL
ncbi:hypothetical protein FB451DRAFT_126564 [Mycena latifolia]|nr:hypothetical protein FB451DRAFT_126564 [Mycena latifolia]